MVYQIAQFQMKDKFIENFIRLASRPNDCVINAMALLGILDNKAAGILRYFKGNEGIQADEISDIFSIILENNMFRFQPYTIPANFSNLIRSIQPDNAAFCGIRWKGGGKHVFIIARRSNGAFVIIDPQVFSKPYICEIKENDPGADNMEIDYDPCLDYLNRGDEWYILLHAYK